MPCGTCIGATFDERAAYRMGVEIANEARTKAAHVLLAPTLNVIRSPLGKQANFHCHCRFTLLESPY
jgi:beta-glucosidase